MMNIKKIGSDFERRVCELLKDAGCWVHFIAPDARGAQPFDVIAVRHGIAYAVECKTLTANAKYFPITRLEYNQRMAFDRWLACRNSMPLIFVLYGDKIVIVRYDELKKWGKVAMPNEDKG